MKHIDGKVEDCGVVLTARKHQFYCSDSNYYSNKPKESYDTVTQFLDDYEGADIDMNLCFRFDIHAYEDDNENYGGLYAEFFLILQRKGIFKPIICHSYNPETESHRLEAYLRNHFEVIMKIWEPISSNDASGGG